MPPKSTKQPAIRILAPSLGSALFVVFYIVATTLYPGGSQADKNAAGFSWINNYWCNLLNEYAINGEYNPARPVAITGMFVLCLTFVFFCFLFAQNIHIGKITRLIIQISGTLAMSISVLLLTSADHDLIINIASFFGLLAAAAIFAGLFKARWYLLLAFGLLNLLLVGLNNYLYYSKTLIVYLPVLQKITFVAFLSWISGINICMYREKIAERRKTRY